MNMVTTRKNFNKATSTHGGEKGGPSKKTPPMEHDETYDDTNDYDASDEYYEEEGSKVPWKKTHQRFDNR